MVPASKKVFNLAYFKHCIGTCISVNEFMFASAIDNMQVHIKHKNNHVPSLSQVPYSFIVS